MVSKRIMIVEDEAIPAKTLQMTLAAMGYEAGWIVSTGDEAIRKAEETRPDLILMDIMLEGGMDGIEAAHQIRSLCNVPVIYLTAYTDQDLVERAKRTGPMGYLLKPFQDEELRIMIEMALEKHQLEQRLRVSEEKYHELVELANSAIVKVDTEGRITFLNEFGEKFFGYTEEEVLGRNIVGTLTPETASNGQDLAFMVRDIISNPDKYVNNVNENILRNGERVWLSWTNRGITDEEGRLVGILGVANDITEHKRVEQELVKQKERFQAILNATTDSVFLLGGNGTVLALNEVAARGGGRKPEEILNRSAFDFLPPSLAFERKVRLEEVVRTGRPARFEDQRAGLVFDNNMYPVCNAEGKVQAVAVFAADISDRRRTEQERDRLFNLSLAMLCIAGTDGMFKRINPAFTKTLGWTEEELLTRPFLELVHPEDRSGTTSAMAKLAAGEAVHDFENRYQCKDGTYKWLSWNSVPVPEEALVFAAARDITERKIAEDMLKKAKEELEQRVEERTAVLRKTNEQLREEVAQRKKSQDALRTSEERFRRLIESSPMGITIFQWGRCVYVNPAFVSMFGYDTAEEILELEAGALYAPESKEVVQRLSGEVFQREEPLSFRDVRGLKKDGTVFDLAAWVTDTEFEGKPAVLLFVADMSEEKSLREQLYRAQKMEALGTMAGGIAHDFNNLLTVVQGFSELLLSTKDEEDQEYEDLSRIAQSAEKGADLVRRILTFSRRIETSPRPLDLNEQIRQLRKMLERTIPKMIEIRLDFGQDLKTINADPGQIEQVLMNLAVNAQHAMPDGGELIIGTQNGILDEAYCESHVGSKPGQYVLLSVTDSGHGMEKEVLDRIFEPFFTTKEAGKGTGLGLAMAYGIVKGHGGHITCYSEPGVGTSFKMYFPIHKGEAHWAQAVDDDMPAGGTETLLLVDDEENVRDLGTRMFTAAGYTVMTATNGMEALEIYREERDKISLIVLDLIMPEMGGKQCLEELLKDDPHVKVIVASGFVPDASATSFIEAGAKGFVGKPFKGRELLRMVRQALDAD